MYSKNPTPSEIVIIGSVCTASFLFLTLFVLHHLFGENYYLIYIVATPLLIFFGTYFIFLVALNRFIYRKIKLIYKTIHLLKSQKNSKPEKDTMSKDIILEMEEEVVRWATTQNQEFTQLKKLEKYRKEFLSNVSHELKTPVFNIQGYLETLIDGGWNDPQINHEYLQKASKNVDRLNAIIEDLELISHLESHEFRIEKEVFNITGLISEVFESLQWMAQSKSVSLGFKHGCHSYYMVSADKERIRQVLTNLIINSIKYGKNNGETLVGIYDMDENILVEVSDNGIGIALEHLPRLFERFYRVDKNRSREQGGTGLGLAIVKHIIEAHNQTINVRSAVGVGSTFGFTLEKVF